MEPSTINVPSIARETVMGGGTLCPGCSLPFHTQRNPQRAPEVAVATGLVIAFEGQLILCESCVVMLAQQIGWIDPEAGKARASDVRRSQKRDEAVRAASDARDSALQAALALQEALQNLDEVLS